MTKYIIKWNREEYGHIIIEAETEEQAKEIFETGEYEEKDLNIKNGGIYLESIEELK
jgi:hypothetical protein